MFSIATPEPRLQIADIGCGTGASTLMLATELDAHIIAVDFLPELPKRLAAAADRAGLADRITTLSTPTENLPSLSS